MSKMRRIILQWIEQGYIKEADIPRVLAVAEILPTRLEWRHFIDRMLLWMGMTLIASGLIFFLAYNWKELGHYAKFALVEVLIVAAMAFIWRQGLDRPSGKAALFAASLFSGALLALIGQTYQTGADTFELFGAWAALILPWVWVGQSAALWLLWLTLINLTIVFYFQIFAGVFGMLFSGREAVLWTLLAFNTVALAIWEIFAARGIRCLSVRWAPRLMATASGSVVALLAIWQILDEHHTGIWAIPAWLGWLAAAWLMYRRTVKDVFVLAGGVFSIIVVTTAFLAKHLLINAHGDSGAFLMMGMIVIALSAMGGWWLKKIAAEDEP